jgi:transcriptional regulator with XRE-family HTH domain
MAREGFEADERHWRSRRHEFGKKVLQHRRDELGLTQSQIAKRTGISQPWLSRIESGSYDNLSPEIVRVLAECYKLSQEERAEWFEILYAISPENVGSVPDASWTNYDFRIEAFTTDLKTIHRMRAEGNTSLCLETAGDVAKRLQKFLKEISDAERQKPLLRLYALIKLEEAKAYTWCIPSDNIWAVTRPIVEEVKDIAKRGDDAELFGLAEFREGDAYYIAGHHHLSQRLLNRALEKIADADTQLWILRNVALNWAYLAAEEHFRKVESAIQDLINRSSSFGLDRLCNALEGLARAQGILGLSEAFQTWSMGGEIYAKMKRENKMAPFREVELIRTQLELIRHFHPRATRRLEAIGQRGLFLAREFGYLRHEKYIQNTLFGVLN